MLFHKSNNLSGLIIFLYLLEKREADTMVTGKDIVIAFLQGFKSALGIDTGGTL